MVEVRVKKIWFRKIKMHDGTHTFWCFVVLVVCIGAGLCYEWWLYYKQSKEPKRNHWGVSDEDIRRVEEMFKDK